MDRRAFLRDGAAFATTVAGAHMVGGCGGRTLEQLSSITLPPPDSTVEAITTTSTTTSTLLPNTTTPNQGINEPATVGAQAERGEQIQVGDTLPPPPIQIDWRAELAGRFVLKANIDFLAIAANYDDGPSPYNTDPILRSLEEHKAFATFYLIGVNAVAWPEIVARIRDAGHEIGNHSQNHWPYEASALALQMAQNQVTLRNISGGIVPISGRTPGLTRGQILLDTARANGYYETHTTIDSGDWKAPRIPGAKIISNILNPLSAGDIPLQHDGGSLRPTSSVQGEIFTELTRRGYKIMTVTDMIKAGSPNPGTYTYSGLVTPRYSASPDYIGDIPTASVVTEPIVATCNYDPKKELLYRRDEDPHTKYEEKTRINEALLQLEEAAREYADM